MPGPFDDLPSSSGPFDDLPSVTADPFADLPSAPGLSNPNEPSLRAGEAPGTGERVMRFLRPLLGPTAQQRQEESVYNPDTQQSEYKPLGPGSNPSLAEVLAGHGHVAESVERAAPDAPVLEKVARGATRGVLGAADALFNPLTLLLGPFAEGAPLVNRAVQIGFGTKMATELPDVVKVFSNAVEKGDVEHATEALTGGGLMAFFAYKGLREGTKPGIATESPALRDLLTKKIIEQYDPRTVRGMYERVNLGQGTPAENEMVRFLNQELASPGEAVRKGVTFESTEPKVRSDWLRKYLGLEPGARTLVFPERAAARPPIIPAQPTTEGEPNAFQEPIATQVPVRQTSPNRQALVQGVRPAEEPPGTSPTEIQAGAGQADVEAAAAQTNPAPSEAQKEAGNYAKGKVNIQGLEISIETPKGAIRSGTNKTGEPWQVEMPTHYGYILGTKGKDKDHIDVYIGPQPEAQNVFVVDQVDSETGKFDEHKVMLGYPDPGGALNDYHRAFSDNKGLTRIGAMKVMTIDEFKQWLKEGDTTKPLRLKEGEVNAKEKGQEVLTSAAGPTQPAASGTPSASFEVSTPPSTGKKPIIAHGDWDIIDASEIGYVGGMSNLQERNRKSAQSKEQISHIAASLDPRYLGTSATAAEGAPVLDANGDRIAGYGRLAAIKAAYESQSVPANMYREFVQREAERLGISEKLKDKPNPVLVRRAKEYVGGTREQFASDSNQAQALSFTPTEIALSDARVIRESHLMDIFSVTEEGSINRQFLDQFYNGIKSKDGLRSTDGTQYLPAMYSRVKIAILSALFSGAKNPEVLVRNLVERADELGLNKKIAGLMQAAGKLLNVEALDQQYSLGNHLALALQDYIEARKLYGDTKGDLNDYMAQATLFKGDRTPESGVLLQFLWDANSGKAVAEFLLEYARKAEALARNSATAEMFGDLPKATVLQLLERRHEQTIQTELLGSGGRGQTQPAEPPSTRAGVEPSEAGQTLAHEAGTGAPVGNVPRGTTKEILQSIAEKSPNAFYRALAKLLLERGITPENRVMPEDAIAAIIGKRGAQGFYDRRLKRLYLSDKAINPEQTLLHEVVHDGTMDGYDKDAAFKAEIDELFRLASAESATGTLYGLTNPYEFITEAFTNPEFQDHMERTKLPKGKTLWQRFVDAIKKFFAGLLRIKVEETVWDRFLRIAVPKLRPSTATGEGKLPHVATSPESAQRKLTEASTRSVEAVRAEAIQMAGQVGFLQRKFQEHLPASIPEPSRDAVYKLLGYDKVRETFDLTRALVGPEEFAQGIQRLAGNPLQQTYRKEVAMRWKQARVEMQQAIKTYDDLLEQIQSDRWQKKMERASSAAIEADLLDQAKKHFEDDVVASLKSAKTIIEKQAFNEGVGQEQIRTLDEKRQYAEAVKHTIREIIEVLSSNEDAATFLYSATPGDVQALIDRYRALRQEVFPDRALPADSVVRWSAEIVTANKDLAQNMIALAVLRRNESIRAAYKKVEAELAKELRERPQQAAKRIVKAIGKFATKTEKAHAAFRTLNKDVSRMARDIEVAEHAATVAHSVLNDPESKDYENAVFQGVAEDRPAEAIEQDPDSLHLEKGITLPDGSSTGPIILYGDQAKFEGEWNKLNGVVQAITDWLTENPQDSTAHYWRRLKNTLEAVYLTSRMWAPPKMEMVRYIGPWGMTQHFVDSLGTRQAALLKVSLGNHARADELARNLLNESYSRFSNMVLDAAESHNFPKQHGGPAPGAIAWYKEIGNDLMGTWQNLEGGLEAGDKINGYEITPADMRAAKLISEITAKGFKIVQQDAIKNRERVMAPVLFKTSIGDTGIPINVSSTPVTKLTTTRKYRREALDLTEAYNLAMARNDAQERLHLLNANFWTVVKTWLRDRAHIFFEGESPFEQIYKAISGEIQQNGLALADRNMDWLIGQIVTRSENLEPEAVREQLLKEFDATFKRLGREFQSDPETKVQTLEARSSFTKARQQKLAGDWLYDNGFRDSTALVDFTMSISGYYYQRAAEDFVRVSTDLERQQRDLVTKMQDWVAQHGQAPERKVRKEVEKAQRIGQSYDDYHAIEKKIRYAKRYAELLAGAYGREATNLDYDLLGLTKLFGVTTASVLISDLTALRNMGYSPAYIGHITSKLNGEIAAQYPKAMWQLWVKDFPKYLASAAYSVAKTGTIGVVKGTKAAALSLLNREGKVALARFLQPMVEEMSAALFERIELQRELFDAGYSARSYAADDVLAKVRLPKTGGAIIEDPLFSSTLANMGFGGLSLYDAMLLSSFGKPLFPRIADLNVNKTAMSVSRGIVQTLENQLRKLFLDYRKAGVNRWDFSDLKHPRNYLEPEEVLGKWFGLKRTQNDLVYLRQMWEWTGKDFQTAAMEFLAKLEAEQSDATLLNEGEQLALGDELVQEVNKASAKNRSLYLKNKNWLWQMVGALMSWNIHRARTWAKYMGGRATYDKNFGKWALWGSLIPVVIMMLLAGGATDVITEEMARFLYKALHGEARATRQPWEREGLKSQAIGWAISMANAMPVVASLVNTMLNDLPNRKSVDPVLFLQNKAIDLAHYVGGVVQSGDVTYGLPQLVKGFLPLSSLFINQIPEVEGSLEASNARRLMRRSGPQELLKDFGTGSFSAGNITPLTPYGEKMISAAMRGDDAGFMQAYNEAVAKATELGKADPEKLVKQMFASRNPYDRVFSHKLTPEQRETFLGKLSSDERAQVEAVETKYSRAAGMIGAPSTFAREPSSQGGAGGSLPSLGGSYSSALRSSRIGRGMASARLGRRIGRSRIGRGSRGRGLRGLRSRAGRIRRLGRGRLR